MRVSIRLWFCLRLRCSVASDASNKACFFLLSHAGTSCYRVTAAHPHDDADAWVEGTFLPALESKVFMRLSKKTRATGTLRDRPCDLPGDVYAICALGEERELPPMRWKIRNRACEMIHQQQQQQQRQQPQQQQQQEQLLS